MVNGITYIDYDKISDNLCWFGDRCVARMVVKLSTKNSKDGTRKHFHTEFKYHSSTYINRPELITIKRDFEYYISLDHLFTKDNIMITIKDILLLRMKLQEVYGWFLDNTFALKSDKMIILNKKKPVYVDGLVGGKSIAFEPIIYTYPDEKQSKGVRATFSNGEYTDISIETFNGILYIFNTIDMFNAAQNMINYMSHPDFGTNLLTFETSPYVGEEQVRNTIKDRSIGTNNKRATSFFDKMDDM